MLCGENKQEISELTLVFLESFDEVHFGKFASYYLERTYYFDVHPPLGKLLFAAVGLFLGYDGHFHFDKIGDDYVSNGVPYVGLRLFPALLGAAVIPLCFLTLKEIGVSLPAAIFGAALLLLGMPCECVYGSISPTNDILFFLDNSLIAQSRLILLDSMLMLFCIMSTYAWIRFYKLRHQYEIILLFLVNFIFSTLIICY